MRRVNLLAAGTILSAILVGCAAVGAATQPAMAESDKPFISVGYCYGRSSKIVYHCDTKVMYTVSCGNGNCGTFCLLVNADGSPMIWES